MLFREIINEFEPYSWEPSNSELAARAGIPERSIVRLDTNTSPIAPTNVLRRAFRSLGKLQLNQYPDTSYSRLRKAVADYAGCDADSVIPTNGADEAIDIISKIFLEKGTKAITSVPTYGYFRISAELQGAEYIGVPRKVDFSEDIDALLSHVDSKTRLIFVCNPNNPTGNLTPLEELEKICKETEAGVLVDEAYYEYCGVSALKLTERYPNLIVVRTLSKAFGLAGIRIGYIVAAQETVKLLNKARPPNSLGTINITVAETALKANKYVMRNVKETVKNRELLFDALSSIEGVKVYPSNANFLLVRFLKGDANDIWWCLLKRGLVVRNLSFNPATSNSLRITIGLQKHVKAVIKAIKDYMGE